jgi:hypothetical protein
MNKFIGHSQVITTNNYHSLKTTVTAFKVYLVKNLIWLTLQLIELPSEFSYE